MHRSRFLALSPLLAGLLLLCSCDQPSPLSPVEVEGALTQHLDHANVGRSVGRLTLDRSPFAGVAPAAAVRTCISPSVLTYVRYEEKQGSYTCTGGRCTFNPAATFEKCLYPPCRPKTSKCMHGWACVARHESGIRVTHLEAKEWTGDLLLPPGQWSLRMHYGTDQSVLGLWRGVDAKARVLSQRPGGVRVTGVRSGSDSPAKDGTDFGTQIEYWRSNQAKPSTEPPKVKDVHPYLDVDLQIEAAAIDQTLGMRVEFEVRRPRLNTLILDSVGPKGHSSTQGHSYYVDSHRFADDLQIKVVLPSSVMVRGSSERLDIHRKDLEPCRGP